MKLLDQLELKIADADWRGVCDIYNKLTGKNISPPNLSSKFDPIKASKSKLYEELKKITEVHPISKYSKDELVEMWELFTSDNLAVEKEILETADVENFEWVNPKAVGKLKSDKKKPKVRLNDFPVYDDEGRKRVSEPRKDERVLATCKKCGAQAKVNPVVLIAGNNEKKYICPKCNYA